MATDGVGPFSSLDSRAVAHWASQWNDNKLWDDVLLLADRAWMANSDDAKAYAWHHLLFAVGNFKRQGGRRIRVFGLGPREPRPNGIGGTFTTPSGLRIDVNDQATWEALERDIPGVATPTCTTLLAALWPDQHFIFDWRVRAVASGLLMAAGLAPCESIVRGIKNQSSGPVTMGDYGLVRSHLLGAELNLRDAERAMYEVSRHLRVEKGRTWETYGAMVTSALSADYLAVDWARRP